jgi:hypothetical protein
MTDSYGRLVPGQGTEKIGAAVRREPPDPELE